MRRQTLLYGLIAGVLVALLRAVEYRWLVLEHSLEIYGGLVAAIFAAVGLWLGLRLTRKEVVVREVPVPVQVPVPVPVPAPAHFERDLTQVATLGLTPRELEILEFMADGLSNREIAERASVSENTVKTHASRVLDKLGAARRTQAIQRAKVLRLIP